MSVVVITRNTICSDRQSCVGSVILETQKIFHVRGSNTGEFVAAFTGSLDASMELLEWLKGNMDPKDFPAGQRTDNWARAVVMLRNGDRLVYEQTPFPLPVVGDFQAHGDGQAFALGALHVGALAGDAVMATNRCCASCGFGVEGYTLEDGEFIYWSLES